MVAKPEPLVRIPRDKPAGWEERSTHRVLELRRDHILERSRKLVDAAYELIGEDGLQALTIRAVLKKTGLSRRAFYERFADKDDLMLAVFEQTIRQAARYYDEAIAAFPDPLERLRHIVTSIATGTKSVDAPQSAQARRRATAMSREHLRLAESRPRDLQMALGPLLAIIAEQLSQGMQLGQVRQAHPQRLAVFVYNLVATTVHTEFLAEENSNPDRVRRAQLAADIWDFCRRGIAA